jgi:endonuclease/exonuclease/phosphatase family metal-dependent hydrolase
LVKAGPLPGVRLRPFLEPRGALWATVEMGEARVHVITTHLGLGRHERLAQIDALLGREWLGHPECRQPAILAGDLNAAPRSRAYRRLAARMTDAQSVVDGHRPQATFPSRWPLRRIDHVFVTRAVKVVRVQSVRTPLARVASDHLPLVVDLAPFDSPGLGSGIRSAR